MLVVVKNDLENAFLFQSVIHVLLAMRFKRVNGTVEFLLGICLRIDDRCSEEDIESTFESLGDDLENLSLSRANWTNNGYGFIPSHMLDNTKTTMQLPLTLFKIHSLDDLLECLF
jgi:hypothetical protein